MTEITAIASHTDFPAAPNEYLPPLEGTEGFGCPNDYACDEHCKLSGFRGGYCDSLLWLRCHCYG